MSIPAHSRSRLDAGTRRRAADLLGTDNHTASLVCASLVRDGVYNTRRRHGDLGDGAVLRVATLLNEREVANIHDVHTRCFSSSMGMRWAVTPPEGLDEFNVTVSSADSTRQKVSIRFSVNDVAFSTSPAPEGQDEERLLRTIAGDSHLRLNIVRHLRPVAVRYLENAIRQSKEIPHSVATHYRQVADSVLSQNRMFPYLRLIPRPMPDHHGQGEEGREVTIDVTFSLTFELGVPSRSNGNTFSGVQVEDNAAYFSVAAPELGALEAAAEVLRRQPEKSFQRAAEKVERTAIAPARRRKRQKEIVEQGPPKATRHEVITLGDDPVGDDAPSALDITIDETGHPEMIKVASVQGEVDKAAQWWKRHGGLIKPSLSEMATNAIAMFGDAPVKRDADLLVDMAMPAIGQVAKQRYAQYNDEFGVDVASAGLAALLKKEVARRLR